AHSADSPAPTTATSSPPTTSGASWGWSWRCRRACGGDSPYRAARSDRPQRLDLSPAHAYEAVVEVHRRVAMARHEQQLLAELRGPGAGGDLQHAVLVRRPDILDARAPVYLRQPRVDARSLEPGIEHRAVGGRRAHHRGEHEKALLEARPAFLPDVAVVVGVHEHVGARLDLVEDAARALQEVRPRARPGDRFTGDAGAFHQGFREPRLFRGGGDRRAAVRGAANVLRGPVVGVQAGEVQAAAGRDAPGERQRGPARRDPAT